MNVAALVESCFGFIRTRVNRRAPSADRDLRDELFQAGCLAAAHAAQSYDPARGQFTTWCTPWVDAAIRDALEAALSAVPGGWRVENGVRSWSPRLTSAGESPLLAMAAGADGRDDTLDEHRLRQRVREDLIARMGDQPGVARSVDAFLLNFLEGRPFDQMEADLGVRRARAHQLAASVRPHFQAWAADMRGEA